MSASELLGHPAFQLWAAAVVPFAARFAAAWTSWQRVHGLVTPTIGDPRDRIPSGRSPSTTDPSSYDNINERKGIACHETGHIFGLRHNGSTSSCMHNTPGQTITLIQGEVDLLNANY